MLKEFKSFVLRGNVIDLAVGVAVGAAFSAVVTSFTKNMLTPVLAMFGNAARFADLLFTIRHAQFRYGQVIDDLIAFVLIAATLFFLVVRPVNHLMARRRTEPEVESTTRKCPECLSSIPIAARRCAFCTATVAAAS